MIELLKAIIVWGGCIILFIFYELLNDQAQVWFDIIFAIGVIIYCYIRFGVLNQDYRRHSWEKDFWDDERD